MIQCIRKCVDTSAVAMFANETNWIGSSFSDLQVIDAIHHLVGHPMKGRLAQEIHEKYAENAERDEVHRRPPPQFAALHIVLLGVIRDRRAHAAITFGSELSSRKKLS